jgi:hypothetical protein
MMLVLAMQFSRAGWPQCPQIGLEGQRGCGERAEPTTKVVGAPSKRNRRRKPVVNSGVDLVRRGQ